MRMMSIASGSSGNCIYIGSDNTHILIDAGVSRKRIVQGLNSIGLDMTDIGAILVTHEHSDHIKGLGVISRKDAIPMYSSKGTARGIIGAESLGKVDSGLINTFDGVEEFEINDLHIQPIRISHDANEPTAFRVNCGKKSAAVMTDLGYYDDTIIESMTGLDSMLVESNHDIRMLQTGSYSYYLKQRILSDRGHLSNEDCGRMLARLLHDNIKHVFLGHLSHENNYPQLAFETVKCEIDLDPVPYFAKDFDISVAGREENSKLVEF